MSSRASALIEANGYKFGSGLAKILDEEIERCLLGPKRERAILALTKTVIRESPSDRRELEATTEIVRIFDITLSSRQGGAMYDVEEIRKVEKLGYTIKDSLLMHVHSQSQLATPSISDLIAFITTDIALGCSLRYVVIAKQGDKFLVNFYSFKRCVECANFLGPYLKNAPQFDVKFLNSLR